MGSIHRHIVILTRVLLAVLLLLVTAIPLIAVMPRGSAVCAHRDGRESRKPSCCRQARAAKSQEPKQGCCNHDAEGCCCSIVPMARFFSNAPGDPALPSGALPDIRFVSPLHASPSAPPVPPPRA